jgi:hypothetical protein
LYAEQAQKLAENNKSTHAKAFSVAIAALRQVMSQPVKSEQELAQWLLLSEEVMEIASRNSRIYQAAVARERVPPTRELKQFRAFNSKHNEVLNDMDYQIERWEESLKQLESRAPDTTIQREP